VLQQTMPRNVVRFERIVYLAWALAVILWLLEWRSRALPKDVAGGWLTMFTVLMGLEAWWIWLVARRRKNWARWTSVVALVVSLPGYFYFLTAKFQDSPIFAFAYLLDAILWYVPFYFLFTGDAPAWFKPQQGTPVSVESPPR
jgi:hypothetical protein